MKMSLGRPRGSVLAAFALIGALATLSGCGSGHTGPGASPTPNSDDQMVQYVHCMREHGVNIPDDPNATGFPKPAGGAAALQAAEDACRQYAPPKMRGAEPGASSQDQLLAIARCLREHGLNVPDPQPGQNLHLPTGTADDPAAQRAISACMKPTTSKSDG